MSRARIEHDDVRHRQDETKRNRADFWHSNGGQADYRHAGFIG
jgi:hypothetical protein